MDDGGGLTTKEAFDRLFNELTATLEAHRAKTGSNWREILTSSFSTRSHAATITWCSLLVLFIESLVVLVLYSFSYGQTWNKLLPEGITMFLICVFNICLVTWYNYKRINELPIKLEKTIKLLKDITEDILWSDENYPDQYMPLSPCITLQWCFRDGKLVNLPWVLLVTGDIVVLQPAQKVIADCHLLNDPGKMLCAGQIFSPVSKSSAYDSSQNPPPCLHTPISQTLAVVTLTPYLSMVEVALQNFLVRPTTFYNKERHMVVTRIIECCALPLAMMIFVVVCLVRMFYLPHWLGIRVAPWADITLLQPMANTFPLLPVSLPLIWTLLHCIGNAKIWENVEFCEYYKETFTNQHDEKQLSGKNEKVQLPSGAFSGIINWWKEVVAFFTAKEETLSRSQKLLHVLASVTALCCVDKKGILSWPNPSADKLFFLRDSETSQGLNPGSGGASTVAEVLDVSHDNNDELHFDDTDWEEHLPNLKPLGLNILLNTCGECVRPAYTAFHYHITHELQCNKTGAPDQDLVVPVTSRRCLCEVAKIIGFSGKATDVFSLEQELCSFRHIESDQLSRDKLAKAKIKFPFPHTMSVVVKERVTQTLQMMSQGTGDLVLDICEDFWDGKDLKPLTDYERKLVLDFYQRTSLSSICTAFSYKPLPNKVSPSLASLYLELPPSKGLRFLPFYKIAASHEVPHTDDTPNTLVLGISKDSSVSTDCLITDSNKNVEVNDLNGCLHVQSGQIFIGMVTMQYQACVDMVQLIEQLDQACIRFVHFSKENELRSRVFSEKMGLESGWNCHISLSSNPNELANIDDMEKEKIISEVLESNESNGGICRTNRRKSSKSISITNPEESLLLPRCSSSVPEMVLLSTNVEDIRIGDLSLQDSPEPGDLAGCRLSDSHNHLLPTDRTPSFCISSENESHTRVRFEDPTRRSSVELLTVEEPSAAISPTSDSYCDVYDLVEHPTPLGFDMSNRAKLPRGIEQVRPHLENVDNVPLLVSLFTDCTADNAREMIRIMQDYGEVTLLLGSVCNFENKYLFLQADASIAFEPMYPQSCQKSHAFISPSNGCPGPTEVAKLLTSLPCSMSFRREESAKFYSLIAQARHFMNNCVRSSIQFWISCNIAVTFLGFIAGIMLLPPLFSLSDSIWLTVVVIPLITLGTAFAIMEKVEDGVMDAASWKNQYQIDRSSFVYAFWFFGMKFIPSIINVILMAVFNLTHICEHLPNSTCSWVYPVMKQQPIIQANEFTTTAQPKLESEISTGNRMQCVSTWSCENAPRLMFVQQYSVFFLVFYFVVISACFVHRSKYLWRRNPLRNRTWVTTVLIVMALQALYSVAKINMTSLPSYSLLNPTVYFWGGSWVIVALALNELIRKHEIRINIRYQKRARLDFGTKLGMNSPF